MGQRRAVITMVEDSIPTRGNDYLDYFHLSAVEDSTALSSATQHALFRKLSGYFVREAAVKRTKLIATNVTLPLFGNENESHPLTK